MNDSTNNISRWLHERPLQDNPQWLKQAAVKPFNTWDEWIDKGRAIPDIENHLIWILDHDKDPVNRGAAALALGFVSKDEGISALITSLKTDVPMVAMEAAASLGRLGISKAIGPLCEAIRNPDENVRANACTALGTLGGEIAISCLKDAVHDKNAFVQAAADEALQRNK